MKVPRSDQDLARLRGTVPDAVIDLLAGISEEDRADLFSTVAILESPADLRASIIVSDETTTIDFGTPLCDAEGAPRILAATWEVVSEPAPGWAFLYEVVSDGGGCAVIINHKGDWVPEDLRAELETVLSAMCPAPD